MPKILLTSGCSFSECISPWIDTWPRHLARYLSDHTHISTGMGSQGNGLISRRVIYHLDRLLKTNDAKDILVGIMWSGPNRKEIYKYKIPIFVNPEHFQENPTNFVPDSDGSWAIMNHNWQDDNSKIYYKHFHDDIGSLIETLEHILRVQWFLKLHNIRYFMTTYTSEVFPCYKNHSDARYLYDQIDLSRFLPVEGEYEWCRDHSQLDFPVPGDNHPSSDQHQKFTEKVILPFLTS